MEVDSGRQARMRLCSRLCRIRVDRVLSDFLGGNRNTMRGGAGGWLRTAESRLGRFGSGGLPEDFLFNVRRTFNAVLMPHVSIRYGVVARRCLVGGDDGDRSRGTLVRGLRTPFFGRRRRGPKLRQSEARDGGAVRQPNYTQSNRPGVCTMYPRNVSSRHRGASQRRGRRKPRVASLRRRNRAGSEDELHLSEARFAAL